MSLPIGKLERVSLREVWPHEAYDFTKWLEDNIDILSEVLDLDLANVVSEHQAGAFSIDLIAEDTSGGTVIIENQLEKSNHDHLGKLITYLTAMSAKAAIWIVSEPRPEHVAAVAWLNEANNASFYMVKLEAVRIAGSPAAPLLTLIVGPSEETKDVGRAKTEIAERHVLRKHWWTALLERAATRTKLHSDLTPGTHSYIGTASGLRGLRYNYTVTQNHSTAELYIDRGKDSGEESGIIFDKLAANRVAIEQAFGGTLQWDRLEEKRACRISAEQAGGYRSPDEQWPEIQASLVDRMVKLERVLQPHIKRIREELAAAHVS